MNYTYQGKPVLPTKTAMTELSEIDTDLTDVIEILEKGFTVRKRGKGVIEKGYRKGSKAINVVVVDMGNWYKLIHAGKFTLSKKFKQKMRDEHGI